MTDTVCGMTGQLINSHLRDSHKSRPTDRKVDLGVCPVIDLPVRPFVRGQLAKMAISLDLLGIF